ncbi:ABC transporter substrate-binding protein [Trichocoleus sp. FACHB-262]|uniref:ABC transporter substrate-binding protein n=1 Tax=Trichocoleus sp. FACHB-262 TaxID=2692869 RepID=UPI001682E62A|nr:ABC transporter substrate-binding protein [Trichocoleus sp. FACHB-262]MBD2123318.1 ABC transporter substrate-binding protein [Trichocoleus sp. FACHB-262]
MSRAWRQCLQGCWQLAWTRNAVVIVLLLLSVLGCFDWKPTSALAAPTSPQVTHLTLWQGVNPPPNRDVLQKLVDRFNQTHTDIQVDSIYVGQPDEQMPKILAAVVGNSAPDMLWFAPMITGQLVELDAIRPLEQWLDQSPLREQIAPTLFETMELENHLWSIPFGTNNVGIFYRPSLFQAAGITQLPQTWEELRQVAQTLTRDTDGDRRIDQHGMLLPLGKGEWTVFNWLPFMWSGGGELTDAGEANPAAVNLANSGAIAALQLWRDLLDDGSAVLSLPERGYELDGFLAGKVAMQLSGPWTLGQLQATGVDFGVIPIPTEARRATASGGENLFFFKSTPEREQAALTFAEYVLSEEFQTQWALGTGYLPTNLKARQNPTYQQFISQQPAVSVFLEQAPYGRSRPIFFGYNRVSEQLGRAIEAVLLGKSTPTAALTEAQRRLSLIFH